MERLEEFYAKLIALTHWDGKTVAILLLHYILVEQEGDPRKVVQFFRDLLEQEHQALAVRMNQIRVEAQLGKEKIDGR